MQQPSPLQPTPERLLRHLDWHVVRRLDGLLQGNYRTLFYGSGVDFAGLREYVPEDDARYIDWNVTARMNQPFVREYHEDRELTAWLLLDRSPSMAFGAGERTKGRVLTEVSVTLAQLLTRSGNRVGAILYNNAVERTIPPRTGRRQVLGLARDLIAPPLPSAAATDLRGLIEVGLHTLKRRSLVFVISDFISEPGWERLLPLLCQRHDVVAIRLWDQREVELPDIGVIVLQDSETGEQLIVDTSDPRLRARLAEVAHERNARVTAAFARAGMDAFDLATDDDLVAALIRMAKGRQRGTQGVRAARGARA